MNGLYKAPTIVQKCDTNCKWGEASRSKQLLPVLFMWRVEEQKTRYGGYAFINDEFGNYLCFFKGCSQRNVAANFSHHVAAHELAGDEPDEDIIRQLAFKYRNRIESSITPSTIRTKSTLARTADKEIGLDVCHLLIEELCRYCDSIQYHHLSTEQYNGMYPNRDGYPTATLANLVFEPLKPKFFPAVIGSSANSMDLGLVLRKLISSRTARKPDYQNAEDVATDVRQALNYIRICASSVISSSPQLYLELSSHVKYLSFYFSYRLESERLEKHFRKCESKLDSRFPKLELAYTHIIELLESVMTHPKAWPFLDPIPDVSNLPNYLEIVGYAMDFSTVYNNLITGEYVAAPSKMFARDVRQIFRNAMLYNEPASEVYECANILAPFFEAQLEATFTMASRILQLSTRYTARDDQMQLLVWDNSTKQYYVEYFASQGEAHSHWKNALEQYQIFIEAEIERNKGPLEDALTFNCRRFGTAPVKLVVPTSTPIQIHPLHPYQSHPTIQQYSNAIPTSQLTKQHTQTSFTNSQRTQAPQFQQISQHYPQQQTNSQHQQHPIQTSFRISPASSHGNIAFPSINIPSSSFPQSNSTSYSKMEKSTVGQSNPVVYQQSQHLPFHGSSSSMASTPIPTLITSSPSTMNSRQNQIPSSNEYQTNIAIHQRQGGGEGLRQF